MPPDSRKPKICIITTVGLSLDKLFPDFYPLMVERGYEVVGICAKDDYVENVRRQGVRVITVPMTRKFTVLKDLKCLWKLYRIFRSERFDLVHYSTPKASLLAAIGGRLAGCPAMLFTARGLGYMAFSGVKRFLGKLGEKIACRWADYVIVIAKSLKRKMAAEKLLPEGRMKVLGAGSSKGVNLAQFQLNARTEARARRIRQELGIDAQDMVIGYAGRLTQDKKLEELLEAFCNIHKGNRRVRMMLVGDQDQRRPLAERTTALIRTHQAIHTVGFQHNIADYLAAMDIFVLPSANFREGFGNVLIEASAMGKAVIATNLAGSQDAVQDGITGILIDRPDPLSLEKALKELIEDPAKRSKMGRNGRQWVKDNFDRHLVWDRTIAVYERMLGQGGTEQPRGIGNSEVNSSPAGQ